VNVIVINDNAHVNGGAAKVAIQEARGLADRGHRVLFLCAVKPIAPELVHEKITVVCTEQHDFLSNPHRLQAALQGWWNRQAAKMAGELLRIVDSEETIVHLHTWSRALSASVIREAFDAEVPTICTLHDFQLACPTGTFFQHSSQQICRLRPLGMACLTTNCDTRSYSQKLWRSGRQLVQITAGNAPSGIRHFIAHSKLAGEVMRPYLPRESVIHALPICIESARNAPASPEQNEQFVYLGRLVREKGVLLAAHCAAAEGLPVTFAGAGPLLDEIRDANPRAIMTGWLNHAESVEHLRKSRALIFPSLWYETLGLVVLEAAAHGIPALVPDTSAAAEVVEDGVTGLHFKSGDELDLRARMREMKDNNLVRTLGRTAYERFWSSDHGSLDAHISSLESIYCKVLQHQPVGDAALTTQREVHSVR